MRFLPSILFLVFGLASSQSVSAISNADMELMDALAFVFHGQEEGERNGTTTRKYYNGNSARYETIYSSADFASIKEERRKAKFSRQRVTLRIRETCVIASTYSHVASKGDSRDQFEADSESIDGTYYLNRITRLEVANYRDVPQLRWVELNVEGQDYYCDPKGCHSKLSGILAGPGADGPDYDDEEVLQRRQKAVAIIRKYCPGRAG